ncbi:unnamed protein product [Citrullus colocynthis]|uniref:Uncharacterized protein n=1 Tax=Citrullus colocynthis TaxID=252529 RepID=A0ABP0YS53_9ROSI
MVNKNIALEFSLRKRRKKKKKKNRNLHLTLPHNFCLTVSHLSLASSFLCRVLFSSSFLQHRRVSEHAAANRRPILRPLLISRRRPNRCRISLGSGCDPCDTNGVGNWQLSMLNFTLSLRM